MKESMGRVHLLRAGLALLLCGLLVGVAWLYSWSQSGVPRGRPVAVQKPPENLTNFSGCPMEGTARSVAVKQLNEFKNRFTPAASPDPSITLVRILATGTDANRWSPHDEARITGYVFNVKPGGLETCNCGREDLLDTHIEVVADPGHTGPTDRMIVEVTPRWRAIEGDWETASLERELKGHWVEFTGWMMFDAQHANASRNTAPGNKRDWRATAWEIHPVTAIRVLAERPK